MGPKKEHHMNPKPTQKQEQKQNLSRPQRRPSIFPAPRLRSAQGLSRLSASLRPLTRHCVALTNPSALLSLLRYGKNERKKMGGGTTTTPKAKSCILSAVAPVTVGEWAIKRQAKEGKDIKPLSDVRYFP